MVAFFTIGVGVSVFFGGLGLLGVIMVAFLAIGVSVSVFLGGLGLWGVIMATFLAVCMTVLFWCMVARTFFSIRVYMLSLNFTMVVVATSFTVVMSMIMVVASWTMVVSATLARSVSMVVQVF
jgi:hypothetical protein